MSAQTAIDTDKTVSKYSTNSNKLQVVLSRLRGVRRCGDGWMALCPVHDDHRPSLKISEGTDGRVLFKCFANCDVKDIVHAMGLKMCDLFPQKPDKPKPKQERKIVATYDYVDEAGKLLYQVVRYEPKDFRARRPDGRGKWVWKLEGVRRVLYRLSDVLEAKVRGETIFLVEGEKDVESLRSLGLCATTNPGGVVKSEGNENKNKTWREEYTETLRGARVVFIPDRDEPGREHAEVVTKALWGKVASLKVVELPSGFKDVTEWLEAGYTREDLEALVQATSDWEPHESEIPQPEHPSDSQGYNLTDLGNAELFVKLFGDRICYVPAWGWLVWDGSRWAKDETEEIVRLGIETVRAIYRAAAESLSKELARHAIHSQSRQRIEAMIKLAEALVAARPDDFDKDPYLLNVMNGTIDLRTGELREHRKEDRLTKLALVEFDPSAECPMWQAFLDRIFAGNEQLIRFMQRAVGYALTGDTREQCLFILYGTGANGKSTFVTTIQAILGDYALQTPTETLLVKRNEYIPNDIARLKGARFVSAIESAEGRKLNEPLVKQMTGGDRISARFLHREFFEFSPEFKIFLATNHKPVIRGTDHAIWRRIRLVPFTVTIPEPEQDKELPRKLLAEAPGILRWAVDGCLAWQREGLGVPEEVKQATASYREEMDVLAEFIADCCVVDKNARVASKDLYIAYESWCRESGEEPLSQRAFGRSLSERGFTPTRVGKGRTRYWAGIGLADASADASGENVRFADQNSEIDVRRTQADATFQVFSENFSYIGKNPKIASANVRQEGDFSDQNALADVIDTLDLDKETVTDSDTSKPPLDDDEVPF